MSDVGSAIGTKQWADLEVQVWLERHPELDGVGTEFEAIMVHLGETHEPLPDEGAQAFLDRLLEMHLKRAEA